MDDITVCGNTAEEMFEKGKIIIQFIPKAGFAIKPKQGQRTCTRDQDGCCHSNMDAMMHDGCKMDVATTLGLK